MVYILTELMGAMDGCIGTVADWLVIVRTPSNTMLEGCIKLEWGSQQAFEAGNNTHNCKIFLQFAISCNAEPSMLLEMIVLDWSQVGGSGLQVK